MIKFNTSRADLKKHYTNMVALVTQMLAHAKQGTLLSGMSDGTKELMSDGTVYHSTYGKFKLNALQGSNPKTETRAFQVQHAEPSSYAFAINSGRDLTFKVFCTEVGTGRFHCQGFVKRGEEDMGQVLFDTHTSLRTEAELLPA